RVGAAGRLDRAGADEHRDDRGRRRAAVAATSAALVCSTAALGCDSSVATAITAEGGCATFRIIVPGWMVHILLLSVATSAPATTRSADGIEIDRRDPTVDYI